MALILINVLVFIAVEFTGTSQDAWHVLEYGAAYTPYIIQNGEVYRLFTSMFLHFGIEHLVNNMLVLFVLGSRLERVIGKNTFPSDLSAGRNSRKRGIIVSGIKDAGVFCICRCVRCSFCSNGCHDLYSDPK